MKKSLFKTLATLNKYLLPGISQYDLNRLNKWQKAMIAYRYWVTINSLDKS